jgi:hypothetical protein
MAAPQNGADLVLEVETAVPTVYVAISDMDNFDDSADQNEAEFPVFGNTKYIVPAPRQVQFTMSGFRNIADAGQILLLAAEKLRTEIRIRVKYDGENGYTVLTRVKSRKGGGKPEGLQTIAFDFIATATAVIVGTGPVI